MTAEQRRRHPAMNIIETHEAEVPRIRHQNSYKRRGIKEENIDDQNGYRN